MNKNWTHQNFIIHEFEELESTNSHAFELASLGKISDHEIIFARKQSGGRGRKNRSWVSPEGNLYFSLILRPKISAEKLSQLSFLGIAALNEMVKKVSHKTSAIIENKWPNDLLLDGKKIAGSLLESKISGGNSEFAVLGIGLNLTSNPDNTIFPATNLLEAGVDLSAESALKNFLDEFEKIYQNWLNFGFAGIRNLWLRNAFSLGKEIKVTLDEQPLRGIFEDLDLEGNLLLRSGEKIVKISVADVS